MTNNIYWSVVGPSLPDLFISNVGLIEFYNILKTFCLKQNHVDSRTNTDQIQGENKKE